MPIISFSCKECNKESSLYKKPSHKFPVFCSRECHFIFLKVNGRPEKVSPRQEKDCEFCGVKFFYKKPSAKRRFCSSKCRGAWQSSLPYEDWKKKLSDNKENRPSGKANGMWGKSPGHGKWHDFTKLDGENLRLRSSWELAVARFLDQSGINFEYEKNRFHFENCTYMPDFFLPDEGVYWEVKGWMSKRSQKQITAFRENHPEIPLVIIDKQTIRFFANQTNTSISI